GDVGRGGGFGVGRQRGGVGYNDGGGGDSGWRWWFRWQRWRVAESEYGDRVDPLMRITFDLGRKSPPEKFSGGGAAVVAGGWPDPAAGEMGEREGVVCVYKLRWKMKF
ncbi:hypothetical protein Tco_1060668, partial [Tanacetum coccineum]